MKKLVIVLMSLSILVGIFMYWKSFGKGHQSVSTSGLVRVAEDAEPNAELFGVDELASVTISANYMINANDMKLTLDGTYEYDSRLSHYKAADTYDVNGRKDTLDYESFYVRADGKIYEHTEGVWHEGDKPGYDLLLSKLVTSSLDEMIHGYSDEETATEIIRTGKTDASYVNDFIVFAFADANVLSKDVDAELYYDKETGVLSGISWRASESGSEYCINMTISKVNDTHVEFTVEDAEPMPEVVEPEQTKPVFEGDFDLDI